MGAIGLRGALLKHGRFLADRAVNVLLPAVCPVTGEPVSGPGLLSPRAWAGVQFIAPPACEGCGAPFAVDLGAQARCGACIATPHDFRRAVAAVVYDAASHDLIVGFKHADRTELAPMFGRWLARAGGHLAATDAIVAPVPLHWRRLAARRYNQSALLANAFSAETGAPVVLGALRRVRPTPPQKQLSADARRRNMAGAFVVSASAAPLIGGRRVVLVDDVLTTGATLSACARSLLRAGAASVDVLVLARVVRDGVVSI